jgi:protein SCO1/2
MSPALALLFAVWSLAARAPAAQPFDPLGLAAIRPPPGARAPMDLAFVDQDGRRTTLRRIAGGKPLLLVPVQHRCPNLCGLTLEGLNAAMAGQRLRPGRDFAVAAVGIDPREGPADAALSVQRLAPAAGKAARGLVGDAVSIAALTHAIGYRYAWDETSGQYAHLAASAVLAPDGRLTGWIYGVAPDAAQLDRSIGAAAKGEPANLAEQVLLLCYHYAPIFGAHTGAVLTALRLAGAATLAALAVAIAWLIRRRPARTGG